MSNLTEEEIDFVINCPVDAYAEDDVLTYCDDRMRVMRLEKIARKAIPIVPVVPVKHPKPTDSDDAVFVILFLMFAATLLCIMFG